MSTPSDPPRGGQQPDQGPEAGRPDAEGEQRPEASRPDPAPPVADGRPPAAGQYPADRDEPQAGPDPGQPYQPYQAQPYQPQSQPYQGQPYQAQPYQPQPYQGQPYQGQPYQAQPYQGQPYPGQPYPGQPYQGQPYQGQPYQGPPGNEQGAYTYSPYGNTPYGSPYGTPYPAGLDDTGVGTTRRPPIMVLSLVLLILSTLPFLAVGAILLVAFTADTLPPELLDNPSLVAAGATPELLVSLSRTVGGILLVIALLYVVLAVLAFRGRNWARIILTIMTVGFALLLAAAVLSGGAADVGSLIFLLVLLVASVGGTAILFLPASARYFANPRT